MRFPVTEREGRSATAPKRLIPGGLTKGLCCEKNEVKKTWQLVKLHGCWWAYEGELPARRHSRRTAAQHVTYSDLFPLAHWQSNSSRDSCLVAKPVPPPTAALHPGARGGGKARLRRNGGGLSWIRSVPARVRTQPLHCSLPWLASSSTRRSSQKRRCREL